MRCRGILLLFLMGGSGAVAQNSPADLYVGAREGEVRLLWAPNRWSSAMQGFLLKRRADGGDWLPLGELIEPPQRVRDYFLMRGGGLRDLREELLTDPEYAHANGFAYIDRTIPKNPAASYEYALFYVEFGRPHEQPADTATWHSSQEVDLDVGLSAADNLWDEKGVEANFKVDPRKFADKVLGFRVIEIRGKQQRDVYRLVTPRPAESGWEYICHQPNKPYPDAIKVVIEDNFGFTVSATSKISERAPKTQRKSVPARKCWGPVMVSVSDGDRSTPREPPPMRERSK